MPRLGHYYFKTICHPEPVEGLSCPDSYLEPKSHPEPVEG